MNELPELTKENFLIYAGQAVENILLISDMQERAERFTDIMDRAREFGKYEEVEELAQNIAAEFNKPELWELPQDFEKGVNLPAFPIQCYPDVIQTYVRAVSKNAQVDIDMPAVVALSILALCMQGKAKVSWANTDYSEPLNLYLAVIAQPSERKSGVYKRFINPVTAYERQENERRAPLIKAYRQEYANIEKQLSKLLGKEGTQQQAAELIKRQFELKPVNRLTLNLTDTTAEALADKMAENGNRIGLLTDEGGLFDTIAGRYSRGIPNLDLILKGFDGGTVHISRKDREVIMYDSTITMGMLVQQNVIDGIMNNPSFNGRGFVQRFLFSIPKSCVGNRKLKGDPIPSNVEADYNSLISRLLSEKYPENIPIIGMTKEAEYLFEDFHDIIEPGLKKGGFLNEISEWGGKLESKTLRIAGLLHLCEHTAQEKIDEKTINDACLIGHYFAQHGLAAYNIMGVNPTIDDAKYILQKLKTLNESVVSKHDLLLKCRKFDAESAEKPLQLLEDMHYIKRVIGKSGSKGGRPSETIKINPLIV